MKKVALIVFFLIMLVVMSYKIVSTSNQSNLFDLMANWGTQGIDPYPWFNATLWDFYANFIFIALFVWHKENNKLLAVLWIPFLGAMGSPGTALYLLIKAFKLKEGEGLNELFSKNKQA